MRRFFCRVTLPFFWLTLAFSFSLAAKPYSPITLPDHSPPKGIIPGISAKQIIIVLDPGHGGEDHGTRSTTKPTYLEKQMNLNTTLFVRKALQEKGYKPLLTRTKDVTLDLEDRVDFANQRKADLFVSIHYNSAPNTEVDGIEIFYFNAPKEARSKKSKQLGECIRRHLVGDVQTSDRGVKQGNYRVIRKTTMPAVLVEGGFITNVEEFQKLKKMSYLKKIAQAIADGIEDFLIESKMVSSKKTPQLSHNQAS